MSGDRLVIFDAFNTLVTPRLGSENTFLAGLTQAGLEATQAAIDCLVAASEGLDHAEWSASRRSYVDWTKQTLLLAAPSGPSGRDGLSGQPDLAARIVPALEQLHQAPMMPMPGAVKCLAELKAAGFVIAVCSNWGWDLRADLAKAELAEYIDILVPSAQAGCRKPHPRVYEATLGAARFGPEQAVFVGDSLQADFLGPQRVGIRSVLLATSRVENLEGEQAESLTAVARLLIDGIAMPDG